MRRGRQRGNLRVGFLALPQLFFVELDLHRLDVLLVPHRRGLLVVPELLELGDQLASRGVPVGKLHQLHPELGELGLLFGELLLEGAHCLLGGRLCCGLLLCIVPLELPHLLADVPGLLLLLSPLLLEKGNHLEGVLLSGVELVGQLLVLGDQCCGVCPVLVSGELRDLIPLLPQLLLSRRHLRLWISESRCRLLLGGLLPLLRLAFLLAHGQSPRRVGGTATHTAGATAPAVSRWSGGCRNGVASGQLCLRGRGSPAS
mmetsp:Transcript_5946/g.15141  ORF Transcript_5946/g.15141 Transcript_5946/m.15141 type:complete len:259 (-) Transcript_5946:36-812(-)